VTATAGVEPRPSG